MEGNAARKYNASVAEFPARPEVSPEIKEGEDLGRYTVSFGLSVAITSILSALLVVVKELNEDTILAWMKHATPHHWITHGLFDFIVFAAVGFALASANGGKGLKVSASRLNQLIVGAVAVSCTIIAGFYLFVG